jgi:hypothetical protein
MDTGNNTTSGNANMGAQTTPSRVTSADVREAVERMNSSVSRYIQDDRQIHEKLSRSMDRPSDILRGFEKRIDDIRRATERNTELIRSYRQ